MKLGKNQLRLLRAVGTASALAVADQRSRRLCELGLMVEHRPGGVVGLTPNGLRALADAVDAGKIVLFDAETLPKKGGAT